MMYHTYATNRMTRRRTSKRTSLFISNIAQVYNPGAPIGTEVVDRFSFLQCYCPRNALSADARALSALARFVF